MAKVGRPTKYNDDMALRICEAIATSTDSYDKICERNPDFPDKANMRLWRYRYPEFRAMYETARQSQADLLIEEINEIAEFQAQDLLPTKDGYLVGNSTKVARDKLRIDTRKWIACKVLPKIYGDKQTVESTVTIATEDKLQELS